MTGSFFQQQLDYVFFLYGLAFLLLGGTCFLLIYSKDKKLPWLWIGLFGLAHGVNEWLDLIALSLGDSHLLKGIRLAFLIVSFLFLVEFGRLSLFNIFKYPRRWIFIPLAIAAVSGAVLAKGVGLNITARYSLGFVGGLFTACCIWQVGLKADISKRPLFRIISVIMGFYALTQIVVPRAEFFPAGLINQDVFLKTFSLPIQVIWCLLAVILSACIWIYWIGLPILLDAKGLFKIKKKTVSIVVLAAVGIALAVAGWVIAHKAGESFAKQERECMLEDIRGLAAAINPERIKSLKGSNDDLVNPDYLRIKEQISLVRNAYSSKYRHIYLLCSRAGRVFFFFDPTRINGGADAAFSGEVFKEVPKELNEVFSAGKAFIGGPFIDKWGMWLNVYAPIKDPATQETLAALGADIDWAVWSRRIFKERFKAIMVLVIIWIILTWNFIVFQINSVLRQKSFSSEKTLSLVVQSIGDGVIITNRNGKVFRMNPVAEKLTGWQPHDVLGRDFSEIFCAVNMKTRHPVENIAVKAVERGKIIELANDTMLISRDGIERLIADTAAPIYTETGAIIGAVIVFRDITDREKAMRQLLKDGEKLKEQALELEAALKEAVKFREIMMSMLEDNNEARERLEKSLEKVKETQEQLIQAEKFSSIGQLASGVAHEVKNPLAILSLGIYFLEKNTPGNKNTAEIFAMIKHNIKRADNIICALVDFSRTSDITIKLENINWIIENSLVLIKHNSALENIKIIKELQENLPYALVDKSRIEQVFINIFLNAVQAMPKGGTVFIRSYAKKLNKQATQVGNRATDYFKPGEAVIVIEVEDTGIGISKENLTKVFDPFFTTKEVGKGTGLGMSVTRNIIDLHKGLIDIESQEGKGTKISIILKSEKTV
ncbi:MAG: ATP-binding protein [Candidatus Omnitrophota bacterium]